MSNLDGNLTDKDIQYISARNKLNNKSISPPITKLYKYFLEGIGFTQ